MLGFPAIGALLRELYRPKLQLILGATAILLLGSLVTLGVPWLVGEFAGSLAREATPEAIAGVVLGILACIALRAFIGYRSTLVLGNASQALVLELRARLLDHLQRLPILELERRGSGPLMTHFVQDVVVVNAFLLGTVQSLLSQTILFLGAAVMIGRQDLLLAIGALLLLPVLAFTVRRLAGRIRSDSREFYDLLGESMGQIEQTFARAAQLKVAQQVERELDVFRERNEALRRVHVAILAREGALGPVAQFGGVAGVLLLTAVLALRLGEPVADVEALVSLTLYGVLMVAPAAAFVQLFGSWQRTAAALERLEGLLGIQTEDTESGEDVDLAPPLQIRCRGLCFAYEDGGEPALENLDLEFDGPGLLLLRGPNGSGKSTLLKMFPRLLEPQRGVMTLQGRTLESIRTSSLRRQIAWLGQQDLLLDRSLRENLELLGGRLESADPRLAPLIDLVAERDPDARLGSGGRALSGGQIQRILLWRVLASGRPLVILDEPTLNLDAAGAEVLLAVLRTLGTAATLVVATHDDMLLPAADRVVELVNSE